MASRPVLQQVKVWTGLEEHQVRFILVHLELRYRTSTVPCRTRTVQRAGVSRRQMMLRERAFHHHGGDGFSETG